MCEPGGILIKPCLEGGGYSVQAELVWGNPDFHSFYPCMQLLKVNPDGTTSQAHDYGCLRYWTTAYSEDVVFGYHAPGKGVYVAQAGYWATANGVYGYYGAVQSAAIVVC